MRRRARPSPSERGGPMLVMDGERYQLAAEAFRSLRTNLQYAALGRPLQVLTVTAAGPDEGKSAVTANLAVALAQGGSRVLAVGADLRRPSLHRAFGLDYHVGLTSVLMGRVALEEAVRRVEPWGLDVLPSGPLPPNPAEMLGSRQMEALLEAMRQRWETVLLDTPPVVALSDAALLAARSDGVLLVVSAHQTPRDVVVAARRQLEQVGARILGVVLNRVRPTESGRYHYYYYYYARDHQRRPGPDDTAAPTAPGLALAGLDGRPPQPAASRTGATGEGSR
ncbi:MAG TPA: CpsD/CapB family tyrosine-protein kinase [Limnochordales bacterium]